MWELFYEVQGEGEWSGYTVTHRVTGQTIDEAKAQVPEGADIVRAFYSAPELAS
jgi:hypothetical protein